MKCRDWLLTVMLVVLTTHSVLAAPRIPTDDYEVLERLPATLADRDARELRALRQALLDRPRDRALAVRLAAGYLEIGRITGDPRYAGYAQAALAPWWSFARPPRDVALLRAQLRQRNHEFDAALVDLDRLIAEAPRDPQLRLPRATIHQVRGDYRAARADCAALADLAEPIVATHCQASVMSVTGELDAAYALLDAAATQADLSPVTAVWVLTSLAEMAVQRGAKESAEAHFKAALSVNADDQALLMAYADFLLDETRFREVIALLRPHLRIDGLLLRDVLARRALKAADAGSAAAALRARIADNAARGETAHQREEARFVLEVERDPARALSLARANWRVQKEPADLRLLMACARAAGTATDLADARQWLASTGLEDVRLAK